MSYRKFVTILFFISFSVFISAHSDYCRIETERCLHKHIGCTNHNEFESFSQKWKDLRVKEFMELDKEFVLTTLNDIKNRIAKGDYTSLGLPSASGFSKIKWNDELGYLAELSVKKLPHKRDACKLIDNVETTYTISMQELSNSTTLDEFSRDAVIKMQSDIESQKLDWIANFFAEATVVGCGAAEYKTKGIYIEGMNFKHSDRIYHVYVIRCVLNTIAADRFSYDTGKPCTQCPEGESCDSVYTSLCS